MNFIFVFDRLVNNYFVCGRDEWRYVTDENDAFVIECHESNKQEQEGQIADVLEEWAHFLLRRVLEAGFTVDSLLRVHTGLEGIDEDALTTHLPHEVICGVETLKVTLVAFMFLSVR